MTSCAWFRVCFCSHSARAFLLPVNFAPMTYAQEVEDAFSPVEIVNHPVIADPDAVSIHTFHAVMRLRIQGTSQPINGRFDSGLDALRQFEEVGIEIARIDLECGAHSAASGVRVRE